LKCKTTLFHHKGHGLCTKCYDVVKKIHEVENSNDAELEKFRIKYIPASKINIFKSENIQSQKEIIKKEIENKSLKYIKQYGEIESENIRVDIVKLETILNEISRRIGNNDNLYTNHLMSFNSHFNEKQRKIIALKLLYMLVK